LRALAAVGAQVVSCDVERVTLLEVLESYERAPDGATQAAASSQGGRT